MQHSGRFIPVIIWYSNFNFRIYQCVLVRGLFFFPAPKFLLLHLLVTYFYFSPTNIIQSRVTRKHNFSTETLVFLSAFLR